MFNMVDEALEQHIRELMEKTRALPDMEAASSTNVNAGIEYPPLPENMARIDKPSEANVETIEIKPAKTTDAAASMAMLPGHKEPTRIQPTGVDIKLKKYDRPTSAFNPTISAPSIRESSPLPNIAMPQKEYVEIPTPRSERAQASEYTATIAKHDITHYAPELREMDIATFNTVIEKRTAVEAPPVQIKKYEPATVSISPIAKTPQTLRKGDAFYHATIEKDAFKVDMQQQFSQLPDNVVMFRRFSL